MTNKRWVLAIFCLCLLTLLALGGITAAADPYFHYHGPLPSLSYPLNSQRYQNDGILRNFDYNAIITGTSVTENFKTSECDSLFGVRSVKVPLEGASLKETGDALRRALREKEDIALVIRSLDGSVLVQDKDFLSYGDYPEYLTDDALLNDVNYLLNKHTLLVDVWNVAKRSLLGVPSDTFDGYSNWMHKVTFGEEAIRNVYSRPEKTGTEHSLTPEEIALTTENITQNVLSLARENPDVTFYCFFPPYSIYYWDMCSRQGGVTALVDAYCLASQLLLQQENIRLYSFVGEFDLVTDPENFCDLVHFHEDINSRLLGWMQEGYGLLTEENYRQHWEGVLSYYLSFDYDALF